ncbi:MAG: WbqC family protein [Fimbriimonadaceae bacterium]|nr:WbqC family protein [Fimbriimonadaceae bacterium]
MIVTIHQPEFMPYGGFFAKALRSDVFVLLDSTQFKKNNWQNRNRVLLNGAPGYLTVPVVHKDRLESTIAATRIAPDPRWASKLRGSLLANYRKHPYFQPVFEPLDAVLGAPPDLLAPLNNAIIAHFAALLGVGCRWVNSSELSAAGKQSELLAALTAELGGAEYLSGAGGRDYLELQPFTARGLRVTYHEFHGVPYPQPGCAEFQPYLSVFDLLCTLGPAAARENLLAGSSLSAT